MVSVSNARQVINLFIRSSGQNLARKPKVVQMFAEDISKLRYAPAGDTFVSNTPKLSSKITLSGAESEIGASGWSISHDGKLIGRYEYDFKISEKAFVNAWYPASWIDSKTGLAKKSLHINYFDTCRAEHQGYGREMMKEFYIKSVEAGCEGRISLEPGYDSKGFYRALDCFEIGSGKIAEITEGLEYEIKELETLLRMKKEGINIPENRISRQEERVKKYKLRLADPVEHLNINSIGGLFFTPTPENVAKLFSK